jgi:hypothetical protein
MCIHFLCLAVYIVLNVELLWVCSLKENRINGRGIRCADQATLSIRKS